MDLTTENIYDLPLGVEAILPEGPRGFIHTSDSRNVLNASKVFSLRTLGYQQMWNA